MSDSPSLLHPRLSITLCFYVIAALIVPSLWALFGLTALVLTKDLLGFADLVINRGLDLASILWIIFYKAIPLLGTTLPLAVLVGSLVGLGNLRSHRELLPIESAGLSPNWLLIPLGAFASALTIIGYGFSFFASPSALRSLEDALSDAMQKNPAAILRPGTVHEFSGTRILAREVSARGDSLRGVLVLISDTDTGYFSGETLFAETGKVLPDTAGIAQLVLHDGVILRSPHQGGGQTRFRTFETVLQDKDRTSLSTSDELSQLTLQGLLSLIEETPAYTEPRTKPNTVNLQQMARSRIHSRFSGPTAALVFSLLALPLARMGSSFSGAVGGILGLIVTIVYYGQVQLCQGLMQAGILSATFALWLPNLTMTLLAFSLLCVQGRQIPRLVPRTIPRIWAVYWGESKKRVVGLRRFLLGRYIFGHFASMLLLSFGVLFIGYLLVDVLERLEWLARHNTTPMEALRFYSARAPLLASRIIPMALLLATALTVGSLTMHRELVGMRACGISATSRLSIILLATLLIAPLAFALNEYIVPKTNALADRIKESEIKDRRPQTGLLERIVWYRAGSHLSQATQLDPALGEAKDVSFYELEQNGLPRSRTHARHAKHVGQGLWVLTDPSRIMISADGLKQVPAETHVLLGEAPDTAIDTMHLNALELAKQISATQSAGYDVTTFRVDLNVKLAAPFACILLPAIVLFFSMNGPPFPAPAVTMLMGILLGVGYVLFTGVCASFGYAGSFSPWLAGWAPVLSATSLLTALAWRGRS